MIQIRDTMHVKFGSIDQAVDLFTGSYEYVPFRGAGYHLEVLTDVSGRMYTLINHFVVPSLADYETAREQSFKEPGFEEWFRQFQLFVEGGTREFFNVEGNYSTWKRAGMIVIRETYHAYKWQLQTAVTLLKRYGGLLADRGVGSHPRILTDASGPMFRAIIEIETESMSTWETQRREVYRQVEFQVWFNQMLTAVEAGEHDFYRVEYTGE